MKDLQKGQWGSERREEAGKQGMLNFKNFIFILIIKGITSEIT